MKRICYLLCLLTSAVTAQTENLNHASTLVDQQNPRDNAQIMAAMTAVVSKKTGLSEQIIRQQGWLDETFKNVILRHYYEQLPSFTNHQGLWFHVVTDGRQLNQMLIDRNIPLWPPNRPQLFVWMVEEHADGVLAHAVEGSIGRYWLEKWLSNKGIDYQFYNPMDADLLQFKPEDVSYLNPDLVDRIFQDYQTDQVLLVKLRDYGSGQSYRAGLFETPDSEAHIENRQFVNMANGFDLLATSIQQRLADGHRIDAAEFGSFTLAIEVNDINGAATMLQLWQYLQNQPLIKDFHATAYGQNSVQFQLDTRVERDAFIKVLSKDGLLQHMPLGLTNKTVFSWQP